MAKKDIIITINAKGDVSFEVKGVKGASCVDETKFLEDALGGGVVDREKTAEYYESGVSSGVAAWSGGEGYDDD